MSTSHTNGHAVTAEEKAAERPTFILHRTAWKPPVAVSGRGMSLSYDIFEFFRGDNFWVAGIYVTLEDGREIIDAVGGAAVACIGNGHPEVIQAIKDQADKLSCRYIFLSFGS